MAGAGAFEKVCIVLKIPQTWHEEMINTNQKNVKLRLKKLENFSSVFLLVTPYSTVDTSS